MLFYHGSFFFLIVKLYFLIPAATARLFNPIAKLVIGNTYRNTKQRSNSRNSKTFSNCRS